MKGYPQRLMFYLADVDILKDQPVFLCCKACEERAQSNPDRTLAKVDELKANAEAPVSK
jgi:hypothetical protein